MSASSGPKPPDTYDHFLLLHGAEWQDYKRALELRGQRSIPRISLLDNTLQFITPSIDHELVKSAITRLLEAWCINHNIGLAASTAWTLQSIDQTCALEPDGAYIFHKDGGQRDPEQPDVALDIILTAGGISRMDIYRRLQMPEVWTWNGKFFEIYILNDGVYQTAGSSDAIPELDLRTLEPFANVRPLDQALREFRSALDKLRS